MADFLESAIEIAQQAGSLLRYYFERHVRFELKGDFDLVTEADRASEKLIVDHLKARGLCPIDQFCPVIPPAVTQ